MSSIKDLAKPRAIIYDWDNTLVDSWPLIQRSIDETLIEMGHEPWGLEKVKGSIHQSMRESFPQLFGDKWVEAGKFYKESYLKYHLEIAFLEGAKELIKTVNESGIMQFVISNKMGPTLRQECQELKVDDLFFAIIGAHDANNDKPSRDPVDLALMGSDLDPKNDVIWFIGDTIADISCALNSGCVPIIFSSDKGKISHSIPQDLIAEHNIVSYFDHNELAQIIRSFARI